MEPRIAKTTAWLTVRCIYPITDPGVRLNLQDSKPPLPGWLGACYTRKNAKQPLDQLLLLLLSAAAYFSAVPRWKQDRPAAFEFEPSPAADPCHDDHRPEQVTGGDPPGVTGPGSRPERPGRPSREQVAAAIPALSLSESV
jgi:hypothetical protein